jgi:hypothetical protein
MKMIGRFLFMCFLVASASNGFASLAGNALQLNGVNNYVCIPNAPQLSGMPAMTLELWYCSFDVSRPSPLVSKSDGSNVQTDRSYELSLNQYGYPTYSMDYFTGASGWIPLRSDTTFMSNEWVHIAGTFDSVAGVAKVFVNGSLSYMANIQTNPTYQFHESIRTSYQDLILGAFPQAGYNLFSYGMMDEVRLWNVARTDIEIAQNYNKTIDPVTYDLVGYWNFDENLNDQLVFDMSSFHNNGMLGSSSGLDAADPVRVASLAPIIPEPATLSLLVLGGVAMLRRKKA